MFPTIQFWVSNTEVLHPLKIQFLKLRRSFLPFVLVSQRERIHHPQLSALNFFSQHLAVNSMTGSTRPIMAQRWRGRGLNGGGFTLRDSEDPWASSGASPINNCGIEAIQCSGTDKVRLNFGQLHLRGKQTPQSPDSNLRNTQNFKVCVLG